MDPAREGRELQRYAPSGARLLAGYAAAATAATATATATAGATATATAKATAKATATATATTTATTATTGCLRDREIRDGTAQEPSCERHRLPVPPGHRHGRVVDVVSRHHQEHRFI